MKPLLNNEQRQLIRLNTLYGNHLLLLLAVLRLKRSVYNAICPQAIQYTKNNR